MKSPERSRKWPYRTDEFLLEMPPTLPNGQPWPLISVITPTYNQGAYIEETILSVRNQNYPNLEYIVIDGGSTDETAKIIEKYRDDITYYVSEKDRGQSHAINKGMAIARGDILTWLNSDDMLATGALAAMAMAFSSSGADMVAGIAEIYRDNVLQDRHLTSCANGPLPLDDLLDLDAGWNAGQFFYQPEVFFSRRIWEKAGGHVAEDLYYSMDYDLWLRFAECGANIHVISRPIAMFRLHAEQKTHIAERFRAELRVHRDAYIARRGHAPIFDRPPPNHSRRLRILFLNDLGWKWGAGIAHQRIADACKMAGHEVIAIAMSRASGEAPIADHVLEEVTAATPDLVIVGNVHDSRPPPSLFAPIADRWPTLICIHDLWWLTGRCAYRGTCRQNLTGCSETCPTPAEYPPLRPQLIHDAWESKRGVLGQDRPPILLAMSRWAQETAIESLGPGSSTIVERFTLGVPTRLFRPADRAKARLALGLPIDKFIVLVTATNFNDRRKGADWVAALIANFGHPDVVFAAVGHGTADAFGRQDNVIPLAYRVDPADLALLYGAVDVIVAPSREETLGQIFLEAAASGTPSVAFANTGVRDAVIEGTTGHLAQYETIEDLKAALQRIAFDPRHGKNLGYWARLYAESEWSLEASYRTLFQTLRRSGLVDRLGLPHKISLGQLAAPAPTAVQTPFATGDTWHANFGIGLPEGPFPELDTYRAFRWIHGPEAELEFIVRASSRYLINFRWQNRLFSEQRITILCDGRHVAHATLPYAEGDHIEHFAIELDLRQGRHRLSLQFAEARRENLPDGRTLALRLEDIAIHQCNSVIAALGK